MVLRAIAATLIVFGTLVFFAGSVQEAGQEPASDRKPAKRAETTVMLPSVPDFPGNVILGRPTATSVTLSLLWNSDAEMNLVWGAGSGRVPAEGRKILLRAGEPKQVVVDGLVPDTRYAYALLDVKTQKRLLPADGEGFFHTARSPGRVFTFTIQADSHLDASTVPDLYRRMLVNALADKPDFHIDLGDTFMTDKHTTRESAANQFLMQRYFFGMIGHSVPLYLVLGNHDGEGLNRNAGPGSDELSVWSAGMRNRFFVNPVSDRFYSGNAKPEATVGLLANYYAWEWGDALFVVLDPYWTSKPTNGGKNPWNMTIGTMQHDWLVQTLQNSKARFKFVFIHQLTGSYHTVGRGGAEAATYQEWGGRDLGGGDGLANNRPGWREPIHRLLLENGVTAVFHGHDHFYARQELDGIIYQLVPQPAHRNDRMHHAEEYGYKGGFFLPNSGHLRVKVTPDVVTVEYVKTADGSIGDSYKMFPQGKIRIKS